mmetsp:Transcript_63296/g.150984  ORF Transcript_63296/g.150984 Transcript_63296/m.150984 type:complete len:176 (-) Transcript_63296:130-657(-)
MAIFQDQWKPKGKGWSAPGGKSWGGGKDFGAGGKGPSTWKRADEQSGFNGKGGWKSSGSKGWDSGKSDWMDKGKGFGKDGKGFGKSKTKGKGHTLDRTRVSEEPTTGVCVEWKGKFGWIEPSAPIDHPKAQRHGGRIFISVADLVGVTELMVGQTCQFVLFEDASGLGAEECITA